MFEADKSRLLSRWDVLRLRVGHRSEMVLLSTKPFCLTTHYVRSTIPCAGRDCPLCELIVPRGLWYVAGGINGRVMMVEFSGTSFGLLEQHAKLLHGGFKVGQVFVLERRAQKRPTWSECVRSVTTAHEVDHFDLCKHVMALYRFPPPNPGESIDDYERRCHRLAFVRNKRAAELLSKSEPRPS